MGNFSTKGPVGINTEPTPIDSGTNNLQSSPLHGPVCTETKPLSEDWSYHFLLKWDSNSDIGPLNPRDKLKSELTENEQIVQIVSAEELQKEYDLKSDAKVAGQAVAPILDSVTAAKILKELGYKTNQVYFKVYKGKQYVIFKGVPGLRKIFRGTRYVVDDPKVVRLAVGPKGLTKAVKGGFVITVVLSVGIEVFDYFINDQATLSNLLGTVTSDMIKITASSIAAAAAGLAVGSAAVVGTIAAAPIIAAISVGIVTGLILDEIDHSTGATAALIKALEEVGNDIEEIEYETKRWYDYFETNPEAFMRLFGG